MNKRLIAFPMAFKGFNEQDVDIVKTMVRLRKIEAEGDKRIEMNRVKEEVNGWKESVGIMLHFINGW